MLCTVSSGSYPNADPRHSVLPCRAPPTTGELHKCPHSHLACSCCSQCRSYQQSPVLVGAPCNMSQCLGAQCCAQQISPCASCANAASCVAVGHIISIAVMMLTRMYKELMLAADLRCNLVKPIHSLSACTNAVAHKAAAATTTDAHSRNFHLS